MRTFYTCLLIASLASHVNGQWVQMPSPTPANLWSMAFFTENMGYMNTNAQLLKTVDGGETWTLTTHPGNVDGDFSFPSSTVGYMAGFSDYIKKTTNAGASWTTININNQSLPIYSVSFPDVNTGYVVGINGFIRKTTNGGATWTAQSVSGSPSLRHVHFVNPNLGTAIGTNGAIRRTTNGGATWSSIAGAPATSLEDIFFLDENIGFIVGGSGTMLKTTNGGANWSLVNTGTTEALYSVCFRNAMEGYVGGTSGFMMKTTNGGLTWATEDNPIYLSTQHIDDIAWKNGHWITIGSGGRISRNAGNVGIADRTGGGPAFMLSPNPASDRVAIHGRDPQVAMRTVRVFDVRGGLVLATTLTGDVAQLDVAGLGDGLYLLEVNEGAVSGRLKLMVQH